MTLPTAGTGQFYATADALQLDDVTFGYGHNQVVKNVSLRIPKGSFVTLLGPSGCGKTTLLKLIGGYLVPSAGRILLHEQEVTGLPPENRNIGMVFQSYALFPHLSARRNVAFGLEVRGHSKTAIRQQVEIAFDRVGLAAELRDRLPRQLSGGQQQRVALARALAFSPPLLLLDEPLASLDRQLREQLRSELKSVHQASRVTSLMVTHDQEEALAVSDLIGVMKGGRLVQFGPPSELYERPKTPFVAAMAGLASLVPGDCIGHGADSLFLIRPEQVRLGTDFPGDVLEVAYQGREVKVLIQCRGFRLKLMVPASVAVTRGQTIGVTICDGPLWEIPDRDDSP